MIFRAFILAVLVGFATNFGSLNAQEFTLHPLSEQCAETEEVQLYELITEYRRINNLPPIPISKSLSYVARVHAMDLSFNRPDFGGCNPHSWSDKGTWTPCCYARDAKRIECMNRKPRELTSYKAKAWEMIYEGGEKALAMDAFELWKEIVVTRDYILNQGKWVKPWKAMGIGFYDNYASLWFGEGDDVERIYLSCGDNAKDLNHSPEATVAQAELITAKVSNYHIIAGSLNSLEKANQEVTRMRGKGYPNASIIPSGRNFRISINSFPSESEAVQSLQQIKESLPDAWVLKPE